MYYMIPESSAKKDIQLYAATDFPLKWELKKILMDDVVAVDTTIYKENDTYWMFINLIMIKVDRTDKVNHLQRMKVSIAK